MYLFKKEIFFTRRYLQELSVSNEVLIGDYQEKNLIEFLKTFNCPEVNDVDGVSILVSHKESPNDKRRRYLNYFADIFIDLDKKIDDNELREIIQKSMITLIIDFFDEELMQVPGFNYRLNLGVHVQVPFFETVYSLRDAVIKPIMVYQNKIMSEIIPLAKKEGSKVNFRISIKPEHIRIYDYESFAPGGIMCLVGHPLLFFSTKAIKRRRISKRDSNYFRKQITF